MIAEGFLGEYRASLRRPHRPIVRVEVWDDTQQLVDSLPIQAGSVECTLNSRITRRGSITVANELMPRLPTDLLAPFGNRLHIYRGIESNGREFWFQVFSGMIQKAERTSRKGTVITFADRANEVDENDFEAAEEALPGNTITAEIIRLIREGLPDASFGYVDSLAAAVSAQVFDDSRAQACDQLAETAGAFWYALADGSFTIRRVPWAYQAAGADVEPVVEYDEAEDTYHANMGTVSEWTQVMSRENVYNIVVGTADQPDGSDPARDVVRDTYETSPTWVGSKFGRRVMRVDFPSASTAAVVRSGADFMRRRSRASADAFSWEMVPDASLELGDVVQLNVAGRHMLRVVSEFTMPLTLEGSMSCSGRPIVLPDGTFIDEYYSL